jgi:hypothetical protein
MSLAARLAPLTIWRVVIARGRAALHRTRFDVWVPRHKEERATLHRGPSRSALPDAF